jgi:hypothetical protein
MHRKLSFLGRENWTTGVFHDELAVLDSLGKSKDIVLTNDCFFDLFVLVNGRPPKKIYATETETQAQFKNPKLRSIAHLKHIEENLKGRYAYTPTRVAPRGTGH